MFSMTLNTFLNTVLIQWLAANLFINWLILSFAWTCQGKRDPSSNIKYQFYNCCNAQKSCRAFPCDFRKCLSFPVLHLIHMYNHYTCHLMAFILLLTFPCWGSADQENYSCTLQKHNDIVEQAFYVLLQTP